MAVQEEEYVTKDAAAVNRRVSARPRPRVSSRLRLLMLAFIAVLPSFLKRPCYRLFFGYRVGKRVRIGRYAEIIRMNEINSIPEPDVVNPVTPKFLLGEGSVVTTGHKIDFTDRVEIGRRTILGGRNSSLWTHNRQRTHPIEIGSYTYIGSEIRVAPGGSIPSRCIVGIGSVITGELREENYLIAGVPAKPIKPLSAEDVFLIENKTRPDLPDDV